MLSESRVTNKVVCLQVAGEGTASKHDEYAAANILNRQLLPADNGWSSCFAVGLTSYEHLTVTHEMLRNITQGLELDGYALRTRY
jgi:hypothetical protein